jgi:hypothetical protein
MSGYPVAEEMKPRQIPIESAKSQKAIAAWLRACWGDPDSCLGSIFPGSFVFFTAQGTLGEGLYLAAWIGYWCWRCCCARFLVALARGRNLPISKIVVSVAKTSSCHKINNFPVR